MPATDFRAGEVVTWTTQGDDLTQSVAEHRPVFFIAYDNESEATISYGLRDGAPRHIKVLVSELSREEPPALDPVFFPNGKPYATSQPKQPLTEDQLQARLQSAREKLRSAHERADQARQQVAAARTLADRGDAEVAKVRAELHQVQQQDHANTQELERALREGRPENITNHHTNRAVLEARLKALHSTNSKFVEELTAANRRLTDALDDTKVSARNVIAVLISRETEDLRQQIAAVCIKYAELTSAAELNLGTTQPVNLDSVTAELLATQVFVPKDSVEARRGSTEGRTRRWRQLWDRLVAGEVEADF